MPPIIISCCCLWIKSVSRECIHYYSLYLFDGHGYCIFLSFWKAYYYCFFFLTIFQYPISFKNIIVHSRSLQWRCNMKDYELSAFELWQNCMFLFLLSVIWIWYSPASGWWPYFWMPSNFKLGLLLLYLVDSWSIGENILSLWCWLLWNIFPYRIWYLCFVLPFVSVAYGSNQFHENLSITNFYIFLNSFC